MKDLFIFAVYLRNQIYDYKSIFGEDRNVNTEVTIRLKNYSTVERSN